MHACVYTRVILHACVRVGVCVCVRVHMRVCVRVWAGGGKSHLLIPSEKYQIFWSIFSWRSPSAASSLILCPVVLLLKVGGVGS